MLTNLTFHKVDKVHIGKSNGSLPSTNNYNGPEFREITLHSQGKSFTIVVFSTLDSDLVIEVDGIYGDI